MKILPIVIYPDKRLNQTSVEVEEINEEIKELVVDMSYTMYYLEGVGLSAVQVGRREKIFIVDGERVGLETKDPIVFINPIIEVASEQTITVEEGCLSFPGMYMKIKRPKLVIIKAKNLNGEDFSVRAQGLYARVILHEYDHIIGKTIADLSNMIQKKRIKKAVENWRSLVGETDNFELVE